MMMYKDKTTFDDYLHGSCHQWVLDNYKSGDQIFVITDFDYDIEEYALVHCGIYRNNQYIDVRGKMDDIDEVLDEFDYGEEMDVQIISLPIFIKFCKQNGLIELNESSFFILPAEYTPYCSETVLLTKDERGVYIIELFIDLDEGLADFNSSFRSVEEKTLLFKQIKTPSR